MTSSWQAYYNRSHKVGDYIYIYAIKYQNNTTFKFVNCVKYNYFITIPKRLTSLIENSCITPPGFPKVRSDKYHGFDAERKFKVQTSRWNPGHQRRGGPGNSGQAEVCFLP